VMGIAFHTDVRHADQYRPLPGKVNDRRQMAPAMSYRAEAANREVSFVATSRRVCPKA
jgi:hypothetical protein